MATLLYLDSARMGLMSERAHLAQLDYLRLAAREGCSLYFDGLLREGYQAWPAMLRDAYSHLSDWRGIRELKCALRAVVGEVASTPVLLANRTAQLVALAARRLAEQCHHILVSDLIWPSYRRILEHAARAERTAISTVPLRQSALEGCLSQHDLVDRVAWQYERMSCDGLFLTATSHDGVRLPLDSICQAVGQVRAPRLIVIDGAQAFCQVPDQLGLGSCDMFIAGCHKWLQGHVPMGIAYLPSQRSAKRILAAMDYELREGELDDPLLSFSRQLEKGCVELFSETVSLSSLFACRAALADRRRSPIDIRRQFAHRIFNAQRVESLAAELGWSSLRPQYRTGIVLLQAEQPWLRRLPATGVRAFFLDHGISLSCYEQGVLRLAMPERPLSEGELDLLGWALKHCRRPEQPTSGPQPARSEAVVLA